MANRAEELKVRLEKYGPHGGTLQTILSFLLEQEAKRSGGRAVEEVTQPAVYVGVKR